MKIDNLYKTSIIAIIVCLSVFATIAKSDDSGSCGENVFYYYDSKTNILTFNGTGNMTDRDGSDAYPWSSYRESIKAIVFEGGVTSIAALCFYNCINVESITIRSPITVIGLMPFMSCSSLTSFTIPAGVTSMQSVSSSFSDCTNLTSFLVEDGNPSYQSIDGVLFNKAGTTLVAYPPGKRDSSYKIPNAVTSIEFNAFRGSIFLSSVVINNNVHEMGRQVFKGCTSLTHVSVSKGVWSLGDDPFDSCTSLVSVDVDDDNRYYKSIDGVLFNKAGTQLLQFPCGRKGGYRIPDGVATFEIYAFQDCGDLTSLTIPDSVTSMKKYSFNSNLEFVSFLGTSDLAASSEAFNNCKKLRAICVPVSYNSDEFCGVTNICKRDSCEELQDIENHCFKALCENGEWSSEQRENATQLEKKTNGCVMYQCNNNTGVESTGLCSNNLCVDNQCLTDENKPSKPWQLNVTLEENDEDVNTLGIVESISDVTGLNPDDFIVEAEMNKDGFIIKIIIFVDTKETALVVEQALNGIVKGSDCPYGVLCRIKSVRLCNGEHSIVSGGEQGYESIAVLFALVSISSFLQRLF